jgi:hypothetical protein
MLPVVDSGFVPASGLPSALRPNVAIRSRAPKAFAFR